MTVLREAKQLPQRILSSEATGAIHSAKAQLEQGVLPWLAYRSCSGLSVFQGILSRNFEIDR